MMEDIHIRISEDLKVRVERAAEMSARSLSSIVREGMLAETQRIEEKFGKGDSQ